MQCSTASQSFQAGTAASLSDMEKWEALVKGIPPSVALDLTAQTLEALVRRREVSCAADLLRMVLSYACCDYSLRVLSLWCATLGLGNLTANALRKRFQHCHRWLGMLIVALLQARQLSLPQRSGLRVRVQDATVVSRPGSTGVDWRLHLSLDVQQARIDGIEVTDAHGGETLARFAAQPGEVRLADRGYAHPRGLEALLRDGGQVVVRINWQNLSLQEEDGTRLDTAAWLREINKPGLGVQERSVWLCTPQCRFALRLVACPLPPEKAEEARRRARKTARKNKHSVDERTLLAAGFVLLLTNLPASAWSAQEVLALYRLRWQVEMLFKRLKSLLALDRLRAHDPELAQTYLLGKLLGALLLEERLGQAYACVPADWDVQARPISRWGVTVFCWDTLKNLIRGYITQAMIDQALAKRPRLLCDGPRKRPYQLVSSASLHALSGC
jgi:hypothetical protein